MLAQRRRCSADARFSFRELNRRTQQLHRTTRGMVNFSDHIARFCYCGISSDRDGWIGRVDVLCSCSSVALTSLMAAYGMPLPSNISSHSWVVFVFVTLSTSSSSSSRCATRSAFVTNRLSLIHSGLLLDTIGIAVSEHFRQSFAVQMPSRTAFRT